MSNLVKHAEFEMKRVGLDKPDSDYNGMLYDSVMKLVKVFSEQGHSGFSAIQTLKIFGVVARYKTLSPITSNPDEWIDVSSMGLSTDNKLWQNKRDSSNFSNDGGKSYWCVDAEGKKIIQSEPDQ